MSTSVGIWGEFGATGESVFLSYDALLVVDQYGLLKFGWELCDCHGDVDQMLDKRCLSKVSEVCRPSMNGGSD